MLLQRKQGDKADIHRVAIHHNLSPTRVSHSGFTALHKMCMMCKREALVKRTVTSVSDKVSEARTVYERCHKVVPRTNN